MLKVKNWPFTFSNPAPEASPVLTLGITSKGQVQTRVGVVIIKLKANLSSTSHLTSQLELSLAKELNLCHSYYLSFLVTNMQQG